MIDCILSITKYSGLFIATIYGFLKLKAIKLNIFNLFDLLSCVILAIILYYMTIPFKLILPVTFLVLSILYCLIRYRHCILDTTTITVIACGITILAMVLSFIASIPIGLLTFKFILNQTTRNSVTITITSILHLLFIFLIYRIKRFKSGIKTNINDRNVDILILVSILSIFLLTLFYTDNVSSSPFEIIMLSLIFCSLCLIIWWRKHISYNYKQQLYKRNEENYAKQIENFEEERLKLINNIDELSKIIHRDNKLIPAMICAVETMLLENQNTQQNQKLLEQLKEIYRERTQAVDSLQNENTNLPKTSDLSINATMRFLYSTALKKKVNIAFDIDDNAVFALTQQIADLIQLNTLICDLGENAIIASTDNNEGSVLIKLCLKNDVPCIQFFDNGNEFDENVLANMGKKKMTTHKETGGNGIGLMAMFDILKKYMASYCLDECLSEGKYTKCITITFDNKNTVKIVTPRENIKKICKNRTDFFCCTNSLKLFGKHLS